MIDDKYNCKRIVDLILAEDVWTFFRLQNKRSFHRAMRSSGVGVLNRRTVYVQVGRLPSGFQAY